MRSKSRARGVGFAHQLGVADLVAAGDGRHRANHGLGSEQPPERGIEESRARGWKMKSSAHRRPSEQARESGSSSLPYSPVKELGDPRKQAAVAVPRGLVFVSVP